MAESAVTVRVKGLTELNRALKRYDRDLQKQFDRQLLEAGKVVSDDARGRLAVASPYSAAGIRPRVRGFGRVVVEQSRRRTTGMRPDWGVHVMERALLPAVDDKQEEVVAHLEVMLDGLAGEF